MYIKTFTGTIVSIQTTPKPAIRYAPKAVQSIVHTTAYYLCIYINITLILIASSFKAPSASPEKKVLLQNYAFFTVNCYTKTRPNKVQCA
jgi:hypothetical protein